MDFFGLTSSLVMLGYPEIQHMPFHGFQSPFLIFTLTLLFDIKK